jgi:hypothetical protein
MILGALFVVVFAASFGAGEARDARRSSESDAG